MKESYGKGLWPALLSLIKTPYALFCQHLRWLASISPSRPPQIPPSEKTESCAGCALDTGCRLRISGRRPETERPTVWTKNDFAVGCPVSIFGATDSWAFCVPSSSSCVASCSAVRHSPPRTSHCDSKLPSTSAPSNARSCGHATESSGSCSRGFGPTGDPCWPSSNPKRSANGTANAEPSSASPSRCPWCRRRV